MDIARQRLHRTFLAGNAHASAREVVRALGAVQAQDYEGAKWAVSKRTGGLTDEAIEQAFSAGEILRTHVMRPTWHFVDPLDIRWMLALTGPRVLKTMAPYDKKLGLDEKLFRRSHEAITKALHDGNFLTRPELRTILEAKIGTLGGGVGGVQRMAHVMMRAEQDALVTSGPRKGKQFTYALLDERAPAVAPKDRDEALLDLTRLYFRTRSPATARDYSWWSGLAMADVKRGIDLARTELEVVTIDDEVYRVYGDMPPRPKPSAHLLPNYDEFFIGYRDRGAIGKRLGSILQVVGGNFLIAHVIVIDGQLIGGWRRKPASDSVRLDFMVKVKLSAAEEKRLMGEIKSLEKFLGKTVEVHGLRVGRTRSSRTAR